MRVFRCAVVLGVAQIASLATVAAEPESLMPVAAPSWRVPLLNNPSDEHIVATFSKHFMGGAVPAIPAARPIVVGDYVLMRSDTRVVAVALETGKRIWEFPWSPFDAADTPRPDGNKPRRNQLLERLWDDLAINGMIADGEHAYLLTDAGYTNRVPVGRVIIGPGGGRAAEGVARTNNRLVSLNAAKEGKLRWLVGGADGGDEPKLAGAFFLGAPALLKDQLYVLAEIEAAIHFVVLESASGRQAWSLPIRKLDTRSIDKDPARRLAGAAPAVAGGIAVCPTSDDVVVGVDLKKKAVAWTHEYTVKPPADAAVGFRAAIGLDNRGIGQTWVNGEVWIAEGRAVLTPIDSELLLCLEQDTGKVTWSAERRDNLFVAGVHNGRLVLVGKNNISAVRLDNGKLAWATGLGKNNRPSGRGVLFDGHYYLPTTTSELLQVDLGSGKIVDRAKTDGVLGNLVHHENVLISCSARSLTKRWRADAMRKEVDARLKKNPRDVWALVGQSQLLAGEEDVVKLLRRALQADPENDRVKQMLVDELFQALRRDFRGNAEHAHQLLSIISDRQELERFRILMATGWHEIGEHEKAIEAYAEIMKAQRPDGDAFVEIGDRRVRRSSWVQARLNELRRAIELQQP